MLMRAQKEAAEEERAASRRLAELERQRDAVNAQLSRLHEALAAALAPSISIQVAPRAAPSRTEVSLPLIEGEYDTTGSLEYADSEYEDDEYVRRPGRRRFAGVRRRP